MEVRVVNSGIDGLVIGFSIAEFINIEAFKLLDDAKAKAGEKMFGRKSSSVTWFGKDFIVSARGTKGYEWILENADVRFYVAKKAQGGRVYPEVYVTFRADYLWRMGHVGVVQEFQDWLQSWAVVANNKVSRCDLCIDIQMELPKIDLAKEAVTRARGKVEYYETCEHYVSGRLDTGYRIGSGALIGRIYDKSLEITISKKEWFKTIWSANGWDGESRVIRAEFQARRDFLKKMSVDSFLSLCERLADMWRYYTHDWLTIRIPCGDSHRHRWEVAEWWKVIQDGFTLFGKAYGLLPFKQHQFRYEHLMRQARGVLVSAIAVIGTRFGVEHGYFKVGKDIQEWLNATDFRHDVTERMASMATLSAPIGKNLVDEVVRMGGRIESVEYPNSKEE